MPFTKIDHHMNNLMNEIYAFMMDETDILAEIDALCDGSVPSL